MKRVNEVEHRAVARSTNHKHQHSSWAATGHREPCDTGDTIPSYKQWLPENPSSNRNNEHRADGYHRAVGCNWPTGAQTGSL